MKNLFYLLLFVVLFASFFGCNNSNNSVDEAWKTANTNAYDSIAKLPDYHALKTATGPTGVYYKVIKKGTGTVYPLQTSDVKMFYSLSLYNGTVFDSGTSQSGIPQSQTVNGTMYGYTIARGLSFALQNMVVGDKWEIWIPYYLGYGATGLTNSSYQTVIQGYTTLVFTVELVSITEYPK